MEKMKEVNFLKETGEGLPTNPKTDVIVQLPLIQALVIYLEGRPLREAKYLYNGLLEAVSKSEIELVAGKQG